MKEFDTSFTFRATNSNEVIKLIKTIKKHSKIQIFLQRSVNPMLISLPIMYVEITIIILKKVNFLVYLNMLTLYLCIRKKKKNDKANCKPVIILPNMSKIYEKLMYQQLYNHFYSLTKTVWCLYRSQCPASRYGYAREIQIIKG